jgi:hypothetical protein
MSYHIATYKGLAKILCCSEHTLKKTWRALPHFYIGEGRNLKGARFNIPDVINYLKKGGNYDSVERFQKESLDCKVSVPEKTIQEGGFSDKIQGTDLGGRKAGGIKKSTTAAADPFNLLAGVNNVS